MLAYSDARSEAGDLLGSEVIRRAGIGGQVSARHVTEVPSLSERWVLFNVDAGLSRRCNGYKRQGAQ